MSGSREIIVIRLVLNSLGSVSKSLSQLENYDYNSQEY